MMAPNSLVNFDPASYFLKALAAGNDSGANLLRGRQITQQGEQFDSAQARQSDQFGQMQAIRVAEENRRQQEYEQNQTYEKGAQSWLARQAVSNYSDMFGPVPSQMPTGPMEYQDGFQADTSVPQMPQQGGMAAAGAGGGGQMFNMGGGGVQQTQQNPQLNGMDANGEQDTGAFLDGFLQKAPGDSALVQGIRNMGAHGSYESQVKQSEYLADPKKRKMIPAVVRALDAGTLTVDQLANEDDRNFFAAASNFGPKAALEAYREIEKHKAGRRDRADMYSAQRDIAGIRGGVALEGTAMKGEQRMEQIGAQNESRENIAAGNNQSREKVASTKATAHAAEVESRNQALKERQDAKNQNDPQWRINNIPEAKEEAIQSVMSGKGWDRKKSTDYVIGRAAGNFNQERFGKDDSAANKIEYGKAKDAYNAAFEAYDKTYFSVPPTAKEIKNADAGDAKAKAKVEAYERLMEARERFDSATAPGSSSKPSDAPTGEPTDADIANDMKNGLTEDQIKKKYNLK